MDKGEMKQIYYKKIGMSKEKQEGDESQKQNKVR